MARVPKGSKEKVVEPDIAADPLQAAFANLHRRQAAERQLAECRAALLVKPNSVDLLVATGEVLTKLGRNAEAAQSYAKALALAPGRSDLRHLVAALGGQSLPARADDGYVAALFDAAADSFDSTLVGMLDYRVPELVAAAAREALTGTADIVDLGCGTGLCGPLLKPLARRLDGVDLSPRMIDKARARNVYDGLAVGEISRHLRGQARRYGLAVAADVLVYMGDLVDTFAAVAGALNPGGRFVFTVERHEGAPFHLGPAGRYAHADAYIRKVAADAGMEVVRAEDIVPRQEKGRPVAGRLYVTRRT